MLWFGGNIAEAVTLSKQRNAIFVVFVEGDNDLSTEMSAVLGDSEVTKRLSDETNFLAIKLKSGSENYTHFAQIYQFVPVPSLFFIGRNGTPLEVVCAGVASANLAQRIDRILDEHRKGKQPAAEPLMQSTVQPSTSSQNVREQTVGLLLAEGATNPVTQKKCGPVNERADTPSEPAAKIQKTEHHEPPKSAQEHEVVCDGDVCVRRPKVPNDGAGPSTSNISPVTTTSAPAAAESTAAMEEKLEKAKELIEARRREKAEKEKDLERQKELERRSQGQGVAELRKWQADQELKQIQEERKREKLENNLARQRILEQIAQDRAERRARDMPPAQNAQNPAAQNAPSAQNAHEVSTSGDGSARARVQFKLPDGSSHTAHFDAEDTLSVVHRYIANNLKMSQSSFSLWTAFPRRELTESDATLRRLELAPSAALLVLPGRQAAHVASPSALSSLVAFITQLFSSLVLEPSHQVYAWIRARLFGGAPPRSPSPPAEPSPHSRVPPGGVRRRGNIHRLPGEGAADDDNNTWNGNSTQQM